MSSRATITRPERPIRVSIDLPRSKSIANRALILASLAGDLSALKNMGDADDTRILHELLRDRPHVMHCGLGGTTFRFLLAWACVQEGEEHIITGDARLLERPHDALVQALRHLGADIERSSEGYRVRGKLMNGGELVLDSPISSQYLSALMLIAPRMEEGLRMEWRGTQLSRPYVEMTARVMRHFGADVDMREQEITVKPGRYVANALEVQRDWSAASFWYEMVALADDAEVELPGLEYDGWQGDETIRLFMDALVATEPSPLGIMLRKHFEPRTDSVFIDVVNTPDLFQPMVFAYAMHDLRWTFTGLHNLALKETDRLAAVKGVLAQLGVPAVVSDGTCGSTSTRGAINYASGQVFETSGDHRMAMSLAPLALVLGSVIIKDPEVVSKSYPGFWDDLKKAGFGVELTTG